MFTWLTKLKSQLVLILGALVSGLLLYISAQKQAVLRKEIERQKGVSKARDRYTNALKEGLENEAKKVKRGYFDGDS